MRVDHGIQIIGNVRHGLPFKPESLGEKIPSDELRMLVVPVIAISARPALAGPGFFDIIGKPARIDEVARVVAAAIRHHRGRDG